MARNGDNDGATLTVDGASSINQYMDAASCRVYPNPASDLLNVVFSENMTKIELVSLIGQTVMSEQVSGLQTTVDVSNYVDGIYFLTIYTQNGKITKKISISK